MIINSQTPNVETYRIYDTAGSLIPLVQAYDTDTREVTVLISCVRPESEQQMGVIIVPTEQVKDEDGNVVSFKFAPLTLTFVVDGSFATCNGEVVPPGEGMHPAFLQPAAPVAEESCADCTDCTCGGEVVAEQAGVVEIVEETPVEVEPKKVSRKKKS